MPKSKSPSQFLGNGRGAFRKAFLSLLLDKYSNPNAMKLAEKELGKKCTYCGISSQDVYLQPDFLWPQSKGGIHEIGNVVPACPTCNSKRGSKDWIEFMRTSDTVITKSTKSEIEEQIKKITAFMKKYNMEKVPNIEDYLSESQIALRESLDLLLDAITQGIRAKTDNPQQKGIKFKSPAEMFDELVKIAESYKK